MDLWRNSRHPLIPFCPMGDEDAGDAWGEDSDGEGATEASVPTSGASRGRGGGRGRGKTKANVKAKAGAKERARERRPRNFAISKGATCCARAIRHTADIMTNWFPPCGTRLNETARPQPWSRP